MYEELMEQVVRQDNARAAWLAVKRNGGAPGIDGMTTDAIGSCGYRVKGRCVQPPDAENRTSGGVGGCRGAIPGTRPDFSGAAPQLLGPRR